MEPAVGVLGGGLTSGLAEGINAGKGLVTKTVSDLALDSVISPFKRLLGINSPSLVYNEFGQDVAQGFEDGLVDRTSQGFKRWAKEIERAGGEAFIQGIEAIARRLGINPNHLMNVLAFESGFNPRAKNPISTASGLIQFMKSTTEGYRDKRGRFHPGLMTGTGFSHSDLRNMSAIEQLKWVEKYFRPYAGRMHNQGDVYAAVAGPAALSNGGTLYRRGSREYRDNRIWDANGDGVITSPEIGGLAARKGGFPTGGFTVNNSPVSDTNPVPVYGVAGLKGGLRGIDLAGGTGEFTGDTFDPAAAPAVLARAQVDLTTKVKDTVPVVVEVNDKMDALVTATENVIGAEAIHYYQTQQLTQATQKQTLAAGHAAQSVIGLAKSAESTGQKLFQMIGGLAGIVPQQQVGKKRGFFSKLLGFAAPFLSFIPGVGPILSAAAGIGASALAGDWAGAVTGAVTGFGPGGAFRGRSTPRQPTVQSSGRLNAESDFGNFFGGGRAFGGPVEPGLYYEWQERGREYFAPRVPGRVLTEEQAGAGGAETAAVLARLALQLERMESRPAGEWLRWAAKENPGAITDGFMEHGARDARVVEWMQRRVEGK